VTKDNLDLAIKYGNVTKADICNGLDASAGGSFCS
jgi:hypothetical protein